MSDPFSHLREEQLVEVQLPLKEYKILKQILEERQAMSGLKAWITSRLFWGASGIQALLGVFEYIRRFGE